jgi:hypothetical protein
MVGGAVAEEVKLLFFEAIFHLPSGTVAFGMEALGTHLLSAQGGDDKVVPYAVGTGGHFADDPAGTGPTIFGLIGETAIVDGVGHQPVQFLRVRFIAHLRLQGVLGLLSALGVVLQRRLAPAGTPPH